MHVPLEIEFRNVPRARGIDRLLKEKMRKITPLCNTINRCKIIIEKHDLDKEKDNPYSVQIQISFSNKEDIVVLRKSADNKIDDNLYTVVSNAFEIMRNNIIHGIE
jgi:hypothetical protein